VRTLWRISDRLDLEGNGGRFFSSRWSIIGRRIVYMAESPAGALLEVLVHLGDRDRKLPRTYTLLEIEAHDELHVEELPIPSHSDWQGHPEVTQPIGDAWLESVQTPLARVPSAIVPRTWNFLLNPEHPGAGQVKIVSVIRERFDLRLLQSGVG
jgi:RES domain-containing protein